MYINEIPSNTNISIIVKLNDNETVLETTTIEVNHNIIHTLEAKLNSKCIIAKAIYIDNKKITFDTKAINLTIEASIDNKQFIWKNVKINSVVLPNIGSVYLIVSNINANFTNRRNNFRVSIGIRSIAHMNNKRIGVTIKDMSNTGIGLIAENNLAYQIGNSIKLSFEDRKMKATFNIDCVIVRTQELKDGYILLGCIINNIKPNPNYYINKLQRELLKHN